MDKGPRDVWFVGGAAGALSLAALLYFFLLREELLLYGDAVAHINIARRVFDSITPGPLQLGTVWLPLPHVLMVPFAIFDKLWRTGLAGAFPSMLAYIAGAMGVFRLLRARLSRPAAWLGAGIFALNPGLLYLQTTAMTEPLYLMLFVWSLVHLDAYARSAGEVGESLIANRALKRAGWVIAAACLTRYDGWFLAFGAAIAAALVARSAERIPQRPRFEVFALRKAFVRFLIILALAPALWLAYNAAVWGDPLEFATGPHSARAIAERTTPAGSPGHPGQDSPPVAALHFLKAAKLNLGEGRWQQVLITLAAAGALLTLVLRRRRLWLLLWLPLPFYALSIAFGATPIFVPPWWPFSYYNVRYGLQLLPAVAVFVPLLAEVAGERLRRSQWLLAGLLVAVSYVSSVLGPPITLREARVNSVTRLQLETALARELDRLPRGSTYLMYTSEHVGALQRAGIKLERVVHEGNFHEWPAALQDPAASVDYVIAAEGDPVARIVRRGGPYLKPVAVVEVPGKPRTTIYASLHPSRRR